MSDGMGREFAYLSSHATNRYFIPNWGNIEKEAPKYTSRLIVRLTPQLHKEIAEYAALCGLTTSAYARKRLEGKYPKQRLTDKENGGFEQPIGCQGRYTKIVRLPQRSSAYGT